MFGLRNSIVDYVFFRKNKLKEISRANNYMDEKL